MVLSFVPTPFTAVMMARATPARMRPYSMAVAPELSFKKVAEFAPCLKHRQEI